VRPLGRSALRLAEFAFLVTSIANFTGGQAFGQDAKVAPQSGSLTAPAAEKKASKTPKKHKVGPLEIAINWRARSETWDWFKSGTGDGAYTFGHSFLRIDVGQELERFDWLVEVAQSSIFGLPTGAVVAAPQGQLGLGGTYYAANGNNANDAYAFVKQAYVQIKESAAGSPKIGRFEFYDGTEVKPKDPTLSAIVMTRLAHRLISNFGFAAFQRSLDGVELSWNSGANNVTFFAGRPDRGVFQADGNGELDVDAYYGAYNRSFSTSNSAGQLRLFSVGYVDHRTTVLKTDNRTAAARAADTDEIQIGTFGADFGQVLHTASAGTFDALGWGAFQTGSWGTLTQRAGALVGEFGWQPPLDVLKPWFSAGYSFGSGDGNPNDGTHGTFFQALTTPRLYARFPFYNMMNNEDWYGTLNLKPVSKLALRSEVHALRLASAADLWYLGGGAFQRKTFGFTGRPSNGFRSLANVWDISADYQFAPSLSATLYYGHAWGKSVINAIYPQDKDGQFFYLETNFHF
jgi:Alginate export